MTTVVELASSDANKIVINAPFRFNDLIKGLAGSKYKAGEWSVPLSWPMCLALRSTFGEDLEIGPNLTDWAFKWRNERIIPAMQLRDTLDAEGPDTLYPHQRAGVKFLSTAKRAILADGLGSGKTYTSFATVRDLHEKGELVFPLLIVCPNSTKFSWERAIKDMMPDAVTTVITGTAAQRRKQFKTFDDGGQVLILNWEALKSHSRLAPYGSIALNKCKACGGVKESITEAKCHVHPRELNAIAFNSVIADEAHRMKSGSAQSTRALKAATGDAEYRFALTGTPIANSPDDLWSILNWLYPEAFPGKTKFIDMYLDVSYNMWGGAVVTGIKPHKQAEFFAFLDPILRRMPKEVILPFLPPVTYERREVEMSAKQKKAYEQMRDKFIAEVDGTLLVETSPMTKVLRLLQLASAYMEVEEYEEYDQKTNAMVKKQKVTLTEPSAKLDAFMDDLEDYDGESVVVFHPSKQIINLLAARLDKAGVSYGKITGDEGDIDRQSAMDRFQAGKIQFILCTTGAGGTGITLTKARIAVYLGRPYSGIDSEQSEGRIHRLGSEIHDNIIYRDYVTLGTVEAKVYEILDKKNVSLQEILRDKELVRKVINGESID